MWKSIKLWRLASGIAVTLIVIGSEPSLAAESCRQLEARLASFSKPNLASRQVAVHDRALEKQSQQLALLQQRRAASGCGNGFSLRSSCRSMDQSLQRMQGNLNKIQSERKKLATGQGNDVERRRILKQLKSADCRGAGSNSGASTAAKSGPSPARQQNAVYIKRSETEDLRQSVLARHEQQAGRSNALAFATPPKPSNERGRYRTICVRVDDGYFYPLSFGVSQKRFAYDMYSCQASCAGRNMQLYIQDIGRHDPRTMTSFQSGQPYSALETAFQYKAGVKPQDSSCETDPGELLAYAPSVTKENDAQHRFGSFIETEVSAQPKQGSILRLQDDESGSVQQAAPEHQMKRGNHSNPHQLSLKGTIAPAPVLPAPLAREITNAHRDVRVVGPTFLPAQEAAIGQPVQDQTDDR